MWFFGPVPKSYLLSYDTFDLPAGRDVEGLIWVPLTGLMLYAVAYSLGMGPVPDIVPGEVFPTSVKGLAVSGVNVSLTLFTFLVSKIYTVSNRTLHGCRGFQGPARSCCYGPHCLCCRWCPRTRDLEFSSCTGASASLGC